MPLTISQVIAKLKKAQAEHGDLPCYTADADISRIQITAGRDGVSRTTNGVPEAPNELYIEFIPA